MPFTATTAPFDTANSYPSVGIDPACSSLNPQPLSRTYTYKLKYLLLIYFLLTSLSLKQLKNIDVLTLRSLGTAEDLMKCFPAGMKLEDACEGLRSCKDFSCIDPTFPWENGFDSLFYFTFLKFIHFYFFNTI